MDFLESILLLASENYQPGNIFIILFKKRPLHLYNLKCRKWYN